MLFTGPQKDQKQLAQALTSLAKLIDAEQAAPIEALEDAIRQINSAIARHYRRMRKKGK